jgi:hypothetical protein
MFNRPLQILPEDIGWFHVGQYIRVGKLTSRGIDKSDAYVILPVTIRSGARRPPINPSSQSSAGALPTRGMYNE